MQDHITGDRGPSAEFLLAGTGTGSTQYTKTILNIKCNGVKVSIIDYTIHVASLIAIIYGFLLLQL